MNEHELLDLLSQDQKLISSFRHKDISKKSLAEESRKISARFLDIIEVNGFPYKNKVPTDAYKAAITLLLHTDLTDLERLFDKFLKDSNPNEIDRADLAFVVDKIMVIKGKCQIYGTQYKYTDDGHIESMPIENEKNVDVLRKKAGMEPLDEYLLKAANFLRT